ncbi:MAG: efflux RND transporter periplasmic adaptor subunit [Caulobacterales bacterium]
MSERASAPFGAPMRPPPRKRPLWQTVAGIAVVVLIAVVLALLLSRCASGGGGPAGRGGRGGGPGGRPAITVGVAKAALGDVPIQLTALGTVTPEATVTVTSRVSGILTEVRFQEGQMVRKGALLAVIDRRPFQVALQQAEGALMHDQAQLANARIDLKRYQDLLAEDSVSAQTADTQAALVKQDEGLVQSDKAQVANARLNLSFASIASPVAGRVGLRQLDAGNQIAAGPSTPIAVVTEIDPIDVVFAVPETEIPAIIRQTGPSGGGLPVTAYDREGGTVLGQGSLSTIDNLVDVTTGTVKGKARFPNPDGALFPNQFVNVTVLVDTLNNQVIVPTSAVRHGPQGDFVYVLQPDQTVKMQLVKVGPGAAETVSIASGLQAGVTVITEGGDRLSDGAHVNLPGQKPATAAGGFGGKGKKGGRHKKGGQGAGGGSSAAGGGG